MNIELDKKIFSRIMEIIANAENEQGYVRGSSQNLYLVDKIISAIYEEAETNLGVFELMDHFTLDYTPGKIDFLNYVEATNELFRVAEGINYIEKVLQTKPNFFTVYRTFNKLQEKGINVGNEPLNINGLQGILSKLEQRRTKLENEIVGIYEKHRQIKAYDSTLLIRPENFDYKAAAELYNQLAYKLEENGIRNVIMYETWTTPESRAIILSELKKVGIPWINEILYSYDLKSEYGQLDVISIIYHIIEGIMLAEMAKVSKWYALETDNRLKNMLYDTMVGIGNSVKQASINDLTVKLISNEYSVQGPNSKSEAIENITNVMDEDIKQFFRGQTKDYSTKLKKPEAIAPENLHEHINKNVLGFNRDIIRNTMYALEQLGKQREASEASERFEKMAEALQEEQRAEGQQVHVSQEERNKDRKPFKYANNGINIERTEEGAIFFEGNNPDKAVTFYIDIDQVLKEPPDIARKIETILGLKKHSIYDYGFNVVYQLGNERLVKNATENLEITNAIMKTLDPILIEAFYEASKNPKYTKAVQMNLITYIASSVEELERRKPYSMNLEYSYQPEEQRMAKPSIFSFLRKGKRKTLVYETRR